MHPFRDTFRLVCLGTVALSGWLPAQSVEPVEPMLVSRTLTDEPPYRFLGAVEASGFIGTGFVVQERVVVTAGHLLFDADELRWETDVGFKGRWNQPINFDFYFQEPIAGRVVWEDAYPARVEADEFFGGSSTDTFNLDFGAVYFLSDLLPDGGFIETRVDHEDAVGALREARDKSIVGYPLTGVSGDAGRIYETPPGDYQFFWSGLTDEPDTWIDSGGIRVATYFSDEVITYGGNSGGPVLLRDDQGNWVANAVLVGGLNNDEAQFSLVRSIDETAWEFILEAAAASGGMVIDRPRTLYTQPSPSGIGLFWQQDLRATGYRVFRRGVSGWELIATPGVTGEFVDTEARPGRVSWYRVQTVYPGNRYSPVSREISQELGMHGTDYARVLGSPYLTWFSGGANAFYPAGADRLRSGGIGSLAESYIETTVIGPGTLRFSWDVSSEANPDFDDPDSPVFGDIYDAFHFYVNEESGARSYLTGGPFGLQTETYELGEGQHRLRWVYRKDPYTDEGEDAGFLAHVSWVGRNPGVFVRGAYQFDAVYRLAGWWGFYTYASMPWSYHAEHGWLYLSKAGKDAFWAYTALPGIGWIYVDWRTYPYVYSTERDAWLFYYRGTGEGGAGHWFYDFTHGWLIQIPD